MKNFLLSLAAVAAVSVARADAPAVTDFDISWISDQHVTGVNKEPGHATLMPYATRARLLADPRYDHPWLDPQNAEWLDLNGTWKFRWVAGTPDGPAPTEFQAADLDDSAWDDIRVPLNWEMVSGYNAPTYNNTGYPFVNEAPRAMTGHVDHGIVDHNATGFYRRTFDLPADWADREIFIHFDGVYSCAAVWVNGAFVGYSQGANNVAEFDLTDYVHPGENQLSVRVYRWCDGSYLEGQDIWRLSGIHRDVYLYATPKVAIRDHYATTSGQADDATAGTLNLALRLENRAGAPATKTVKMDLLDADGNLVSSDSRKVEVPAEGASVDLATPHLTGLKPWCAESPYLYTIVVSQYDGDGREEMAFATKYGFRKIVEVNSGDNKYFTINGKRIFFKGTNIHDSHPLYGRYVDIETMLRDITMMKQANINTVRTSHYPRHEKMYAMFDAYGLYVVNEGDLECHGDNSLTSNPEWTDAFVDRDVRMVMRDRNHPSVIFWSIGNENGSGPNLTHCYNAIRALDSRPIHNFGDPASDVSSDMYTIIDRVKEYSNGRDGKPFFMCEYAHAMGQAVGNLVDYWEIIENSNGIIGGCIWDWVDQAIYHPDSIRSGNLVNEDGFHHWTGGCDFDPWFEHDATLDKEFMGNFLNNGIVTPDRRWTAKLTEIKKVYQNVEFSDFDGRSVRVRNKYPFTDLGDWFYLTYELRRDGIPVEDGVAAIAAAPGETVAVPVALATDMTDGAEYAITFGLNLKNATAWAERGYRLADEQFRITPRRPLPPVVAGGRLRVKGNRVEGDNFTVTFDDRGAISSYIFDGHEIIAAAPEYNDFRRIDNDTHGRRCIESTGHIGDGKYDYAATGITGHEIVSPLRKRGNRAEITMRATGEKSGYTVTYTVYPTGQVDMRVTFDPQIRGLRRLGLGMAFAPGFEQIEYYARGPWTNYVDRCTGSYLGRYQTTMRDMVDENTHPQSYGDRLDLRSLVMENADGYRLRIDTEGEVSFSLSHYDELEWNHLLSYVKLHWADLEKHPETFAHFDYRSRGIGNRSCGGDHCLVKYELPYPGHIAPDDTLTYTLRFTPQASEE